MQCSKFHVGDSVMVHVPERVVEPGLGLIKLGLTSPTLISDLGTVPYSDSEHALGPNFNSTLDSNHGSVLDSVLIRSRLSIQLVVLEVICEIWYTGYHRRHVSMVVLGFFSPRKNGCPISGHADDSLEVHSVPLPRQPQPATFLLTYLPALPTAEVALQMRDPEQI
ncbi:hypothetical protein EVAR_10828_1 [Eumeta japonica]|uniref:Uncharacterized protein n=1 Tax=Eumeta variegata TaxID=151549 RepID=A0A4C1Y9K1_EUMVA|nr:hypothetical protein EVAR_10828_1 [Eumeta japonica]